MQDQLDFLYSIAARLDAAGIPYMLTGSLAMSIYVEPRMTRDIDLVVECDGVTADQLVRMFKDDCYVSEAAVRDALSSNGMFNIIHLEGVSKADFIVRRPEEFRRTEFDRRGTKLVGGHEIQVAAPEDLFLSKLLWWAESDSALQHSDLRSLLDSLAALDMDYIEHWAGKLGVGEHLKELLQ